MARSKTISAQPFRLYLDYLSIFTRTKASIRTESYRNYLRNFYESDIKLGFEWGKLN